MKASKPETQIAAVVDTLFRRWPWLVGFCVQEESEPSAGLVVTNVATDPWRAELYPLYGEIVDAVLSLADEEPAARELLRGRTFARTLH